MAISNARVDVKIDALQTGAGSELATPEDPLLLSASALFGNGTGAGQANTMWHDQRTLGPSATENIDLSGVLVNAFGVAVNFTAIKAIFIRASSTNNAANNVNVQRGSTNGWVFFLALSDGFALKSGDFFCMACPTSSGHAVTGGTGDLLTITNSAGTNSVVYDIWLLGIV